MQASTESQLNDLRFLQDIRTVYPALRFIKKAEWVLVEKAYEYALRFHKSQNRHDGSGYIVHIQNSVHHYLRMLGDSPCDYRSLVALILHDAIEDNQDALLVLAKDSLFPPEVITKILWMTKPKPHVLEQVRGLEFINRPLYNFLNDKGFIEMYDILYQKTIEEVFAWLQNRAEYAFARGHMSPAVYQNFKTQWHAYYSSLLKTAESPEQGRKICAEYVFLFLLTQMPEEIFRIKVAERMDNLESIQSLIEGKSPDAGRKMLRTSELYLLLIEEAGWTDEKTRFERHYDNGTSLLITHEMKHGVYGILPDDISISK